MKLLATGASGFIGTNLSEELNRRSIPFVNVDLHAPLDPAYHDRWQRGDIMDPDGLRRIFDAFQPTHVIHLAARADCDENTTVEEGYAVNTVGTENVLQAVAATPSIERLIVTSTQFVCAPDQPPDDDADYSPFTVYGQSKVETERITRRMDPACTWSLVRPVNIWGPWHLRYRREFWRVMKKGLYVHPGRKPVIRTYGYVGNVIHQALAILDAPPESVHRKVFYLGDAPADIHAWVDAFSRGLTGKPVRVVPRWMLRAAGGLGDLVEKTGGSFPITRSRFRSMITDYPTPTAETIDQFGSPHELEDGVRRTIDWLNSPAAEEAARADHPANAS